MNTIKKYSLLVMLFIGFLATAQKENILLDRSFWKENPNIETVKNKIAAGNNATALNENAFDAVIYAMLEKADDDVVKYLLSLDGNPIDKKTHDGRIYLHWAAYAGQIEIVKHLLDKGSSVTELDSHGYTPLAFAANAGQKDEALYEAFEKHGVNLVNEKNENGANLLLLVAPSLKTADELEYFINKGFNLKSTDDKGNGIFNYAAKKGNIDFLNLLLDKGVGYKSLNTEGGNAFLFAAQGGRGYSNPLAVYEYLKGIGIEPNIVTTEGYTPLHRLAYSNTDPAIFKFFLTAGADVNQQDAQGNTPFLNAASRNELNVVQLLSKDVQNINLSNKKGQTALMLAVQRNSPEVITFLLENGADVNNEDAEGNTMGYYLVNSFNENNLEAFTAKSSLLKESGLSLNALQAGGNTLYHLAAKENSLPLLQYLSSYNIPINATNNDGLTPLHLAAMTANDDEVLKYLISLGADTTIKTDFEETAYDLASENEKLKGHTTLNFLK